MQVKKTEIDARILSSALNEFAQKGFSAASVREIAKNAGITPGNIYSYYKSKEELLSAVLKEPTQAVSFYLNEVSKGMLPDVDTIEYLAGSITEFYLNNKKAFLILMNGAQGTKYENFRQNLSQAVADRLNRDYFSLSETPFDPLISIVAAKSLIEGLFTLFELSGDDEKRLKTLIGVLLNTMFSGLPQFKGGAL